MVDLNYNFEFDWLIELSDNKLSDLASELVENKNFLRWLETVARNSGSKQFPVLYFVIF